MSADDDDIERALLSLRGMMDERNRYIVLLFAVLDAGRPHSHLCDCDQCNAWLAIRKELRGE